MKKLRLGAQESAVLRTVWRLGSCSVRDVLEAIGGEFAYTTIATVLDRLHDKGFLLRERDGKALVYRPTRNRSSVESALTRDLLRTFLGPDPVPAIAKLVDAVEALDPTLLDELAEAAASRRRSRRGS